MWHICSVSERPSASEYERLVERLVGELVPSASVVTDAVKRDVRLRGRSTTNQIDVLWDLTDAAGQSRRIVFEARAYGRPVHQGRLHEFRSVVDDIQDRQRPVTGVMVTTTGYQSGARRVASTYELVVLELREPTAEDLAGRVASMNVTVNLQVPVVRDLRFEVVEAYDEAGAAGGLVVLGDVEVDGPSGRVPLTRVLDGELGALNAPRPPHAVRRVFDPPVGLWIEGVKVATARAVDAVVGDAPPPPATFVVGGLHDVAWMIRDALSGARTWIAEDDGRVWRTPD
jgi:hypothetical protein